jgi:hypothetical protein
MRQLQQCRDSVRQRRLAGSRSADHDYPHPAISGSSIGKPSRSSAARLVRVSGPICVRPAARTGWRRTAMPYR